MRKGIGIACIFLGIACILGAIGFAGYNRWEDHSAGGISQGLLQEAQLLIPEPQPTRPTQEAQSIPLEMETVQLDGDGCIGILSVPVLELELPVLTPWSYAKLKKAPCHYYGSCYETDFVIAAHNYEAHFGRLSQLQPGDLVIFTDVKGMEHGYEVVLLETLPKEATLEMIASGFDLSLYTCTPGGGNRVTVRCKALAS